MTSTDKTILSGADFTASTDVKYSKPKVNSAGGKSVGILNAASNSATYISTPLMLTWGVNEFVDDKSGKVSYDMSLQFPSEEYAKKECTDFLNNMIEFEDMVKRDAIKNSKEWFGKAKMSEDAVDALWTPMVKYPKDKETGEADLSRSPTLRVKIPFWEGVWKTELYDVNSTQIFPDTDNAMITPKDLIAKGANVALVILCGGIWFANGKFGVTWKLFQGVVKPKTTLRGKCHIMLSSEDKEKLSKETSNDDEVESEDDEPATVFTTTVEDSDDDEAEEVAKEIEEAPKKVVKKKVVKKKTTA